MVNLDTHILVDAVANRLRPDEQRLLEEDFWCISDIVLWEVGKLFSRGRIGVSLDDQKLITILDRITVWPVDRAIARSASRLDFRSDPADEIIAATSIVHGIPLLTRDARILTSTMVPLALR
jgi:PIN domain nuclease of toxin-antitoxin system